MRQLESRDRLDAVSRVTALLQEALDLLEHSGVRNKRLLSGLRILRHESAQQEREFMYAETREHERRRECRRSIS